MKLHHIIFIIFLNAIWGWNFIAVKYSVAEFTPFLSNMLRFAVAFAFLFPFLLKPLKGNAVGVMKIAFTMGVLHFGLLYIGMGMAGGVSAVAIVAQLNVPFATLCAIVMLKEKVGLPRMLAIAISFAGVVIMGFDPAVFDYAWALVVMAVGALAFAVASIFMRQVRDVPAMTIQAWVALAGGLGSLVLTLILEDNQVGNITNGSIYAWGGILFSGILSTVIGHGGVNYLYQKYEVSVVIPYMLLMPFFAVSASVILLDEVLTGRMMVGAGFTLLGVIIVTMRNRKKMQDPLIPGEET